MTAAARRPSAIEAAQEIYTECEVASCRYVKLLPRPSPPGAGFMIATSIQALRPLNYADHINCRTMGTMAAVVAVVDTANRTRMLRQEVGIDMIRVARTDTIKVEAIPTHSLPTHTLSLRHHRHHHNREGDTAHDLNRVGLAAMVRTHIRDESFFKRVRRLTILLRQ